jgi:MFS superfamily sulfate permease-like transporter
MTSRSSLRGDLAGGIAGGIVTIPSSIGYGILALGSLGDAFIAPAILAGLYGAVVVSLVVILLGQWTTTAFAPRSIITVLFATIVIDTVLPAARQDSENVERTLALVALIVYVLSEDAFNAFIAERPVIAVRLLANLARELSFRLRNATRVISELER